MTGDSEHEFEPPRGLRGIVGAFGLLWFARKLARNELMKEKPGVVALNARVRAIEKLAWDLAEQGHEDDAAIEQALARRGDGRTDYPGDAGA